MNNLTSRPRIRAAFAAPAVFIAVFAGGLSAHADTTLDYRRLLMDPPAQSIVRLHVDTTARRVTVVGDDFRQPTIPFEFDWGDGAVTRGFFPAAHTYKADFEGGTIRMLSTYPDRSTALAIREFHLSGAAPCKPNPRFPVSTDFHLTNVKTVLYDLSSKWDSVSKENMGDVSPKTVTSLFSAATGIISGFFGGDHDGFVGDRFPQIVFQDTGLQGGAYSVWYTRPVGFAIGRNMTFSRDWSSVFHEMGHNIACNSPKGHRMGGRLDGNGNAILTESTAQILQHAAGRRLIEHAAEYGIDAPLRSQIAMSCESTMMTLARFGRKYVRDGCPFAAWDKPNTPQDETLLTFMYLAYRFCRGVEEYHVDWDKAVTRYATVLRTMDEPLYKRLDNKVPTDAAATADATLMVAAVSHGLDRDMRRDFRQAKFPIDDALYEELLTKAKALTAAQPADK